MKLGILRSDYLSNLRSNFQRRFSYPSEVYEFLGKPHTEPLFGIPSDFKKGGQLYKLALVLRNQHQVQRQEEYTIPELWMIPSIKEIFKAHRAIFIQKIHRMKELGFLVEIYDNPQVRKVEITEKLQAFKGW